MLVLTRHESETVVLPDLEITIQIVRLQGKTVRVGIDAPRQVRILRGEVTDDRRSAKPVQAENREEEPCTSAVDVANTELSRRPLAGYLSKQERSSVVRETGNAYQIGGSRFEDPSFESPTIAC